MSQQQSWRFPHYIPMLLAYTRAVGPNPANCELTHIERRPLDLNRAMAEHAAYERLLTELGATVRHLQSEPDLPDAVFVEDTAIVPDEIAVITRPRRCLQAP